MTHFTFIRYFVPDSNEFAPGWYQTRNEGRTRIGDEPLSLSDALYDGPNRVIIDDNTPETNTLPVSGGKGVDEFLITLTANSVVIDDDSEANVIVFERDVVITSIERQAGSEGASVAQYVITLSSGKTITLRNPASFTFQHLGDATRTAPISAKDFFTAYEDGFAASDASHPDIIGDASGPSGVQTLVPPIFTGDNTGFVVEDYFINIAQGVTNLAFIVLQGGNGVSLRPDGSGDTQYGHMVFATNPLGSVWGYELYNSNTATQKLAAGQTVDDVFTFVAGTDTFDVIITIAGINDAPVVATAIKPQRGAAGQEKVIDLSTLFSDIDTNDTLTLSVVVELDGNEITFDGSRNIISDLSASKMLRITLANTGTYTVTVMADDGNRGTVSSSFSLEVEADNAPVIGIPGSADRFGAGAVTEDGTLTATGELEVTDVDNPPTLPAIELDGDGVGTYGTMTFDESSGEWTYTLAVTPEQGGETQALTEGQTETETFTFTALGADNFAVEITVTGANDAPVVATAIEPQSGMESQEKVIDLSTLFSDIDTNDTLTLSVVVELAGTGITFDGSRNIISDPNASKMLRITLASPGTYTVTVMADDGNGGTVSSSFSLEVVADTPPVIGIPGSEDRAGAGAVTEDGPLTATGVLEVTDIDNPPTLPAIELEGDGVGTYGTMTFDESSGEWTYTLAVTPEQGGETQALTEGQTETETFTFTASGADNFAVEITVTGANDAPVVATAIEPQSGMESQEKVIDLSTLFSDIDTNDTLTLSVVVELAGTGITFDGSRNIISDPNASKMLRITLASPGTYEVTVVADDGNGGTVSSSFSLEVVADTPPVIGIPGSEDRAGAGAVTEDGPLTATGVLEVTDIDNPPTLPAIELEGDGVGTYGTMTFDESSGEWTYTLAVTPEQGGETQALTEGQTETETFTFTALGADNFAVEIMVTGANDAPVVATAIEPQSGVDGREKVIDLSTLFTDVDEGDELTFTVTLDDGAALSTIGLTYDSDEDEITGTLTGTGTYVIKIVATDKSGATVETTFDLNILSAIPMIQRSSLTYNPDETSITIDETMLEVISNNQFAPTLLVYTITTLPDAGVLSKSGTQLNNGDTFTQADINNGLITYVPPVSGSSTSQSNPMSFTFSDGVETLEEEQTLQITSREVFENAAPAEDNEIDQSIETTPQKIEAGDGSDIITGGTSDDQIDGGAGDDEIILTRTVNNVEEDAGADEVLYTFGYDGVGIDGGDEIVGFKRGQDKLTFVVRLESSFVNLTAFLESLKGADDEDLTADDAFVVTMQWGTDEDGDFYFDGVLLHFKDASAFGGGRVSSPLVTVTFDERLDFDGLVEILGGTDKVAANFDFTHAAFKNLDEVLPRLFGEGSIGFFEIVVSAQAISGDETGSVTEGGAPGDDNTGTLTAPGNTITLVSKKTTDSPGTSTGTYGVMRFNASSGEWVYTLDDRAEALADQQTETESFIFSAGGATFEVTITITGANDAPVVESGNEIAEQAGRVGQEITAIDLSGLFTDVDTSDTFTLTVMVLSSDVNTRTALDTLGLEYDSDTKMITGTLLNSVVAGTYTIEVIATDGGGRGAASRPSTFDIVVAPDNAPDNAPVIGGAMDGSIVEDAADPITGTLTITDADDDALPTVALSDGAGQYGTLTFVARADGGVWTYTLDNANADVQALKDDTLTDEFTFTAEGATPITVTITITGANDAPTVSGEFFTRERPTGERFTLSNLSDRFTDVDEGDELTFTVTLDDGAALSTIGLTYDSDEDEITGQLTEVGLYVIKIVATDKSGATVEATFDLYILGDIPIIQRNSLTYNPDATSITIDETMLKVASGNESDPALLVYTITTLPDAGMLLKSGTPLNNGDTFTQADINNGLITYVPSVSSPYTSQSNPLSFTISDGVVDLEEQTLEITSREVVGNTVYEGDLSTSGDLDVNDDTLLASTTPFTISTQGTYGTASIGDDGEWVYKLDNGHADVRALNSGDTLTDTFLVDVNLASGRAKTQTVTITISGRTDVLGTNGPDSSLGDASTSDNQAIFGFNYGDTLTGGSGDDLLVGGYGRDTIDLSAGGIDTVVYRINSRAPRASRVKAEDGGDTIIEFTPGEDKLVILDVNESPTTLAALFDSLIIFDFRLGIEGDEDRSGYLSSSELDAGARYSIQISFQASGRDDEDPASATAGGTLTIFFDRVTSKALNDRAVWDTLTGGTNFLGYTIPTVAHLSSLFGGFGRPGYDAALDDGGFISVIGPDDLPDSYFEEEQTLEITSREVVGNTVYEGDLSTSGDLDVNDDTLLASTTPFTISTQGTYGTASIGDDGEWVYKLDNGHADVRALNSGDTLTDTFVVDVNLASGRAETQTVTITISGRTDVFGTNGEDGSLGDASTSDNQAIFGFNYGDTLTGGSGDDLLVGGYGRDTIDLSAGGIDTVVYRINSRSPPASQVKAEDGADTVIEFTPGEDKLVILDVNESPTTLAALFDSLIIFDFRLGIEGDEDRSGYLSSSELDAGARYSIQISFQASGRDDEDPASATAGGTLTIFFDRVTSKALNDRAVWDTLTGGTNFLKNTIPTVAHLSSLFGGFGRPGYDAALDDGGFISVIGPDDLPDSYFEIA